MNEIIERFLQKGYLLSPELYHYKRELLCEIAEIIQPSKTLKILNKEIVEKLIGKKEKEYGQLQIIKEYKPKLYKSFTKPEAWHSLFLSKYNKLKEILMKKLPKAVSIKQASRKINQEVEIIGMVFDYRKTSSGNFLLVLDDPTGKINVIVPKGKGEFFNLITYDEVIGVIGTVKSKETIIAKEIIFPDVPYQQTKPIFEEDVYVAFVGDTHVGSTYFLPRLTKRFIDWVNGRIGNEKQKEIAEKLKYIFVLGDIVDGVGVFPEQEKELEIRDIYKQYEVFSEFFNSLREDIVKVIIPGNHDGLRLQEPQPPFPDDYKKILENSIENVLITSNPAWISIKNENKELIFLLYHGYGFDYYVRNVEYLKKYKYDKMSRVLRWLLLKRHLAPSHGAIPLAPLLNDYMVIDKVPNVFVGAHIHKTDVGVYKGVLLLTTSCFQGPSAYQKLLGHNPSPGEILLLNLKNMKLLNIKLL